VTFQEKVIEKKRNNRRGSLCLRRSSAEVIGGNAISAKRFSPFDKRARNTLINEKGGGGFRFPMRDQWSEKGIRLELTRRNRKEGV